MEINSPRSNKDMIENISKASVLDTHLARLFSVAGEYAQVYIYAKQRQKGCDGMGELVTMKEEFRDVVDKVIEYCKDKEYISEVMVYDIDLIADEIKRLSTDRTDLLRKRQQILL